MTPILEIIEEENRVTPYDLAQEETYIGRDPKCDIVIRDARISRTHARLWWEGGVLRLEDCRSRNGTKVNGRELQKSESVPLTQGDVIQICNTLFRFRAPPALAHESIPDDSTSIRCTIDAASTHDVALPANAERKLRAILQVTETLGATLDEKLVLSRVLGGLLEVFPRAERGLVLLREGSELAPKAVERRIEREERVVYSKTLIDKVVRGRQAVLSEDVGRDPSIPSADSISDLQLRSIMCVPLLSRGGDVLGVIQLDTRKERAEFEVDDVRVLTCVAAQVSGFVEIVRMHQEIVKHERIRQELNFAREVQFQFLPRTTPNVPGYCFWAFYEPARRVGGDFYNFLELPNGTSTFLLGDAAGKGAPASLVMVWVSWLCKAALLRQPDNLVDAMQAVNAEMSESGMEASFVTLAVGQLNPATHQATFASAGHMSSSSLIW